MQDDRGGVCDCDCESHRRERKGQLGAAEWGDECQAQDKPFHKLIERVRLSKKLFDYLFFKRVLLNG